MAVKKVSQNYPSMTVSLNHKSKDVLVLQRLVLSIVLVKGLVRKGAMMYEEGTNRFVSEKTSKMMNT